MSFAAAITASHLTPRLKKDMLKGRRYDVPKGEFEGRQDVVSEPFDGTLANDHTLYVGYA